MFLSFSALCHWGKILKLRNYLPINDAVWVDAWQSEHEDGGGDEDAVKACQPDQDAVDRVLHLGPDNSGSFKENVSLRTHSESKLCTYSIFNILDRLFYYNVKTIKQILKK